MDLVPTNRIGTFEPIVHRGRNLANVAEEHMRATVRARQNFQPGVRSPVWMPPRDGCIFFLILGPFRLHFRLAINVRFLQIRTFRRPAAHRTPHQRSSTQCPATRVHLPFARHEGESSEGKGKDNDKQERQKLGKNRAIGEVKTKAKPNTKQRAKTHFILARLDQ